MRSSPSGELWAALILVDSLSITPQQRLLARCRSLLTALTPWDLAVWAASCPGTKLGWVAPANARSLIPIRARADTKEYVSVVGVND